MVKNELCALRGGGDVKTFQLYLAPSASNRARASARASASARARARASTNASIRASASARASARTSARATTRARARASASARARVIWLVPRGDGVIGVRGGGLVEASCGG